MSLRYIISFNYYNTYKVTDLSHFFCVSLKLARGARASVAISDYFKVHCTSYFRYFLNKVSFDSIGIMRDS